MGCMKNNLKIPCGVVLYLDFPEREDNHLRKLAGIRRYALTRDWEVQTITREELDRDEVKALCAGDGGRAKPIGCIVEALADIRSILPPRLFGDVPVVYLDPSRPLPWRGVAVVACDNAAVAAAAYDELSAGMPQCYAAVPSCSASFPIRMCAASATAATAAAVRFAARWNGSATRTSMPWSSPATFPTSASTRG